MNIALILLILFFAPGYLFAQQPIRDYFAPSNAKFADEKPRLDQAALKLKEMPGAKIYLLCYQKEGSKYAGVKRRLRLSKDYLISKYGISAERIETVFAGSSRRGITLAIYLADEEGQSVLFF